MPCKLPVFRFVVFVVVVDCCLCWFSSSSPPFLLVVGSLLAVFGEALKMDCIEVGEVRRSFTGKSGLCSPSKVKLKHAGTDDDDDS